MNPLSWDTLRGTWATLLLPIAEDDRIDFARVESQLEFLCRSGVEGVYAHGTAGEFYAISEEEFDRINSLLAGRCEAAGVSFQIGACHLHPREALERVRRAAALKPGAIQVIMPDWVTLNMGEAADFVGSAAAAAGGVPLVIYNPKHAKHQLTAPEFAGLKAAVPSIIGIKVSKEDPAWYAAMKGMSPKIAVFAPGPRYASAVLEWGARGSYSMIAALHPVYAKRWEEIIYADPGRALGIEGHLQRFINDHLAPLRARFGLSGASSDKFLATAAGWTDVGPRMRRPYRGVPEVCLKDFRQSVQTLFRATIPEVMEASSPQGTHL
jgi:dihydrodipicolinate synthase/N-acetylneuraminate lyase